MVLSYRGREFARPKPGNIEKMQMLQQNPLAATGVEKPTSERVTTAMTSAMAGLHAPGSLRVWMESKVQEIRPDAVVINGETIPNDVVFVMIGREALLDFFRRSGLAIRGEWTAAKVAGFGAFLLFCLFLYNWKAGGALNQFFQQHQWFPYNVASETLAVPGFTIRWRTACAWCCSGLTGCAGNGRPACGRRR